MFPLNTVLFPGVSVPLHVFEDRYRALVHHLLRVEDPTDRVFGSVAIREGYEVGDHGAQSLFRVGCRVQLTEVESNADGTFDIVAVGLDRIQLERLDTTGTFPVGHVVDSPEDGVVGARARAGAGPGHVHGLPGGAGGDPRRTRTPAACRATRRTCPGRWPPVRRCRCPSGRRCSRPRTPAPG